MLKWFLKKINNRKGFTLVELIVVISVLGILSTIAVPRFVDVSATAKVSSAMANHKLLISAVSLAQAESGGTLPATGISSLDNYIEGGSSSLSQIATSTWTVSDNGVGTIETTVDKQSSKYPEETQGNVVIKRGTGTTIFTTTINP